MEHKSEIWEKYHQIVRGRIFGREATTEDTVVIYLSGREEAVDATIDYLEEKTGYNFLFQDSDYVPIKMTQTGRPNMKKPEYAIYIEPWHMKEMKALAKSFIKFYEGDGGDDRKH